MATASVRNRVSISVRGEGNPSIMFESDPRDEDSIRQAWASVTTYNGVTAQDVRAIHTDWEPSPADARFLAESLPDVQVFSRFSRPTAADWDASFDQAISAKRQAAVDDAYGVDGSAGEKDDGTDVLPILWSLSGSRAGELDMVPHQILVPGHLAVAIASVRRSVEDTTEMLLFDNDVFHSIGDMPFAEALDAAWDTLATGLQILGDHQPTGDHLLTVHRPGSVAAAALALPNFHEEMSQLVDADRVIVGVPGHSRLLVTAEESERVAEIAATVRDSRVTDSLVPSMWLLQGSGLSLINEFH